MYRFLDYKSKIINYTYIVRILAYRLYYIILNIFYTTFVKRVIQKINLTINLSIKVLFTIDVTVINVLQKTIVVPKI